MIKGKTPQLKDYVHIDNIEQYSNHRVFVSGGSPKADFDSQDIGRLLELILDDSMIGKDISQLLSENEILANAEGTYIINEPLSDRLSVLYKTKKDFEYNNEHLPVYSIETKKFSDYLKRAH